MYKMIVFLKRKAGLTDAAFRDYYEQHHAALVRRAAPQMRKYVRNYLTPMGNAAYPPDATGAVDCVTEAWFATQADCEAAIAGILNSTLVDEIARDEENLFDRAQIRWFACEEVESDLTAPTP